MFHLRVGTQNEGKQGLGWPIEDMHWAGTKQDIYMLCQNWRAKHNTNLSEKDHLFVQELACWLEMLYVAACDVVFELYKFQS